MQLKVRLLPASFNFMLFIPFFFLLTVQPPSQMQTTWMQTLLEAEHPPRGRFPPVNSMTHRCKNITLSQTLLLAVMIMDRILAITNALSCSIHWFMKPFFTDNESDGPPYCRSLLVMRQYNIIQSIEENLDLPTSFLLHLLLVYLYYLHLSTTSLQQQRPKHMRKTTFRICYVLQEVCFWC